MTQTPNTASDKEDWYVAIIGDDGEYNFLICSGSEVYRDLRRDVVRHGLDVKYGLGVVAEEFGISDEVVNHFKGWGDSERRHKLLRGSPLKLLVDRLNSGERLDIQKALDGLCE